MIVADKHHLETVEDTGIESILVGSLCGTDEYANNRRLYSYPSQTLMMFNKDDGKYCQYNIKLA
jgi:protoporphyrinogen oxidase